MRRMDLTGQRFGRGVVAGPSEPRKDRTAWHLHCDCGNDYVATTHDLRSPKNRTESCGCLQKERARAAQTKHGHTPAHGPQPPEYQTWASLKKRCTNPHDIAWRYYGGRGISVCVHWLSDFATFLADMGPRPVGTTGKRSAFSIDRIDNTLGYLCPRCKPPTGNCRWATYKQQANNRRSPGAR